MVVAGGMGKAGKGEAGRRELEIRDGIGSLSGFGLCFPQFPSVDMWKRR